MINKFPIALDFQSTTPCDPDVVLAMEPYWKDCWANPSNRQNRFGIEAAAAINLSRENLASCLAIPPQGLIFTSGATEANNLAVLGYARAKARTLGRPGHLITLTTEHLAVLEPMRQLQREGFSLTEINPDEDGLLSPNTLLHAIRDDTIFASFMLANNEIGVIQPLKELAAICKSRGVIVHSDIVQAFGQIPFNPIELGIDLFTISGHKIYGPKGIGALAICNDISLSPLQWGGGQEQGIRPGTLPVPLIVGLAKAAEISVHDLVPRSDFIQNLRDQLLDGLTTKIPGIIINGSLNYRLPNNLNITIKGVNGNHLYRELRSLIFCSNGSACNNGTTSHVLKAIGRSNKESESSLRLSIGRNTTSSDIQNSIEVISKLVRSLIKE